MKVLKLSTSYKQALFTMNISVLPIDWVGNTPETIIIYAL
jgi:hypothetical protein